MTLADPFHAGVARIALAVAQSYGFALGGGLGLAAHGLITRPTVDIDCFTDQDGGVAAATDLVQDALDAAKIRYVLEADDSGLNEVIEGLNDHMIEWTVYRDASDKVGVGLSLGQLGRLHRPVMLDIGPVMHLDDLAAWKVAALAARAETRDLIDVGAFLVDHTAQQLLTMARNVDPGIEDEDIAAAGRRLDTTPDSEFTRQGLADVEIAELRTRFEDWPR